MNVNHYLYTLERLNKLIYLLTVHQGDIKVRLIEALKHYWTSGKSFPDELRPIADEIDTIVCSKPADEYDNTYKRSLYNKRLKTCTQVAEKIIDLEIRLKEYIKSYEEE